MKKQTFHNSKAQAVFGQHAQNYVQSTIFSSEASLTQLLGKMNPQAGWRMLDIATGGGHTAHAAAQYGAQVIASDLTLPMLQAARAYHQAQAGGGNVLYLQHDAEALPYADNTFDGVTCRIAAHHFPDVQSFVREVARVLKPGGVFGLVDIISPAEIREARYCNTFETLRDPSHVWAHSLVDWELYIELAGLQLEITEPISLPQYVGVWASRVGCDDATIHRLRALVIQAPQPVRDWYAVTAEPGWSMLADVPFTIQLALMIARKPT